ncbi:glycosyltransferase family 2 protein [candidate division WOR-3 bacterium]|nr:glycosyltransferase family 2 protein [candidate division WOR-3 bacterium]
MKISLVIPVFNESLILDRTISCASEFLEAFPGSEAVFVDDGSSDGTCEFLRKKCPGKFFSFKIIAHEKNQGQHSAVITGMKNSKGDLILTSDADLQTPLENFHFLIQSMTTKDKITSAIRKKRSDPFIRRLFSFILNVQLSLRFKKKIVDIGSMFKCYKREVVEEIIQHSDKNTFVPVLALQLGYSIKEIQVVQAKPIRKSRYSTPRLVWLYLKLSLETGVFWHILLFVLAVVFSIIIYAALVLL